MSDTKKKDEKKINLRELDDVACSNVVVARQIKRLINKFPSLKELAMDCWVHGGHYTKFKLNGGKFVWECASGDPCIKGCETLTDDSDVLDKEELNKLIVFTHRAMCDAQNGVEIVDTPEDLLAFAETKLQEMIREDKLGVESDSTVAAVM